jgi:hypothetical protein
MSGEKKARSEGGKVGHDRRAHHAALPCIGIGGMVAHNNSFARRPITRAATGDE